MPLLLPHLCSVQVSTIALTYAGQLVMSGLLLLEVKGWARMVGTRLVALAPALAGALLHSFVVCSVA